MTVYHSRNRLRRFRVSDHCRYPKSPNQSDIYGTAPYHLSCKPWGSQSGSPSKSVSAGFELELIIRSRQGLANVKAAEMRIKEDGLG